jgi:acyl-CoA synthetase (AMP-forming)/AMP-acid ligase II
MLRGRSLFSEYWRNPVATDAAFRDGWFATGDVAYVDDEGYFHIVDRKKNIVIVGSSNVYPANLEKILHEHESIAEAAVVGVPDPETGEALVACVQLCDGCRLDTDEVRALFEDRLASYQHPRHVAFVDDFLRTSLGKVQKVNLAAAMRSQRKADAGAHRGERGDRHLRRGTRTPPLGMTLADDPRARGNHGRPRDSSRCIAGEVWDIVLRPTNPIGSFPFRLSAS